MGHIWGVKEGRCYFKAGYDTSLKMILWLTVWGGELTVLRGSSALCDGPVQHNMECCSCCFCASRFVLWKSIPLPDQLVFHPAAFQCPQVTHEPLKIPWLISCHLTCREGTLWHRPPGVTRALSVSTRLLPSVRWMLWTLRGGAPRAARASGLLFSCSKACW